VGDYYVLYNDLFKKEVAVLVEQGIEKEVAEKQAPILKHDLHFLTSFSSSK
jgi:arginyl-tRNA synthetase